ncbi:MAG: ABC transporter ATP-binding protein [Polyangiaceae bacterium]|nr:ABC transporter ATP-binding protein [Polyangiaceae bacterium]
MALLELLNVDKSHGQTHVLRNASLAVEKGEFVAIVGFSGAGKSTIISLLSGLSRPDKGQVLWQGKPVEAPGPERGVVFQNYSLLPWLTTFENVYFAVDSVLASLPKEEKLRRTERYLAMVGLGHAHERKPAQLSGGMRQRVALARALAADPEVLLMDEPLSALDALTRASLQDEIERIGRVSGKTIVLVTNDVDEAILLADRIVPLSAGPAATFGPSSEVDIPRPRDRRALNHDPKFRALKAQITEFLLDSRQKRRSGRVEAPSEPLVQLVEVAS